MASSISEPIDPSRFVEPRFEGSEDEYNYRSVSRAAVLSVVFGLLGFLSWYFVELTVLSVTGFIFGLVGLWNFRRFPNEISGKPIAWTGGVLSLAMMIVSPVRHTYIYYTELPEGYERISFSALKSPMGAPDRPPESALELDGKKVFLKGYIHPTSLASNSAKSFILVPDWATCCFGQQPPLTHMVEVRLRGEQFANKSFRRHSLAGTLQVRPYIKPIDGLQGVFYELEADAFR